MIQESIADRFLTEGHRNPRHFKHPGDLTTYFVYIEGFSAGKNLPSIWKYHRMDGPAVYSHEGYKEWWVNGIRITEHEYIFFYKEMNNEDEINLDY